MQLAPELGADKRPSKAEEGLQQPRGVYHVHALQVLLVLARQRLVNAANVCEPPVSSKRQEPACESRAWRARRRHPCHDALGREPATRVVAIHQLVVRLANHVVHDLKQGGDVMEVQQEHSVYVSRGMPRIGQCTESPLGCTGTPAYQEAVQQGTVHLSVDYNTRGSVQPLQPSRVKHENGHPVLPSPCDRWCPVP